MKEKLAILALALLPAMALGQVNRITEGEIDTVKELTDLQTDRFATSVTAFAGGGAAWIVHWNNGNSGTTWTPCSRSA